MNPEWEKILEDVKKNLEEGLSTLFQNAQKEIEDLIANTKSKAQEILKDLEEEIFNSEKVKSQLEETLKLEIEKKRAELEEKLKEEDEKYLKQLDSIRTDIESKIDEQLKNFEAELENNVKNSLDFEKTRVMLEEKIKNFIDEETHIFEEQLKAIADEVVNKNQKDIKKNIEKTLKNFYESEEGLKKIIAEIIKNQSDFIATELQEKIKKMIDENGKELLFETPLSEKIAESIGFEMKKYLKEIDNLKTAIDVLEMKIKVLAETPRSVEETSEKEEVAIPHIDVFPQDEGVAEIPSVEEIFLKENAEEKEEPSEETVIEETAKPVEAVEQEKEAVEEVKEEKPETERAKKSRKFKLETPIEITYLGHAAFLIESHNVKIITDPYKNSALGGAIKYDPIDIEADFVTVSHMHMDQGAWKDIPGEPRLVEVAGEKTFENFPFLKFKGVQTYHDNAEGNIRGTNMVFVIEIAGVRLVHLGALGHLLTNEQLNEIGKPVDILMIPTGGYDTLPVRDAWEVVTQLNPLVIVPMRFKTDACDLPLADLEAFTSLANCPIKYFEPKILIKELPTSPEVWVLRPLYLK